MKTSLQFRLIGANNVTVAYKKIYYKGRTRTIDKIEVESQNSPIYRSG